MSATESTPEVVAGLLDLHAEASRLVAAGQRPSRDAIDVVVRSLRADRDGPYWNSSSPSHRDVSRLCMELIDMAGQAEGGE